MAVAPGDREPRDRWAIDQQETTRVVVKGGSAGECRWMDRHGEIVHTVTIDEVDRLRRMPINKEGSCHVECEDRIDAEGLKEGIGCCMPMETK